MLLSYWTFAQLIMYCISWITTSHCVPRCTQIVCLGSPSDPSYLVIEIDDDDKTLYFIRFTFFLCQVERKKKTIWKARIWLRLLSCIQSPHHNPTFLLCLFHNWNPSKWSNSSCFFPSPLPCSSLSKLSLSASFVAATVFHPRISYMNLVIYFPKRYPLGYLL